MYKVRARKHKSSFQTYAKPAFEKSLIISFPQIASRKDWRKKWLKICVFVICFVGSVYQTTEFLMIYFSYPTVFNIEISRPTEIEQPAFTFCNKNKRRRSVVCEKKECQCVHNEKLSTCADFPPTCKLFATNEDKKRFYYKYPANKAFLYPPCLQLTWEAAEKESHKNNTIADCKMSTVSMAEKYCRQPFLRIPAREANHPYELNLCYTVESKVGNPKAQPTLHDNTFYVSILLDTHHEEYLTYDNLPEIQVAIHDQKALINPYKDGVDLKGGIRYSAYVSMTERRYLPAPYDTNCVDYLDQWRKRNGTGPLTQKMCFEYCKMTSLKEKGLCMDRNILYPNEDTVCALGKSTLTEEILKKCTKICGNPCRERTFEVDYEESGTFACGFKKREHIDNTGCQFQFIYLEAFFSRYTLTIISYKPKYDSVEAFSYVGGYIGIWIGLSLVAMFDFLETLWYLAAYPWKKKKESRKKMFLRREHNRVFTY